jgi:DNA-binding helix-turn-helix protein
MFVVANRLKDIRESEGITIEEMADKTGKSVATIYRYERGDVSNIPDDTLAIIASILNKTPEELRGDDVRNAIAEQERKEKEVSLVGIMKALTNQSDKFNQLDLSQIKSLIDYILLTKMGNKR